MKKNYEAPNLEIITYSLHEAIAAGCDLVIYDNFNYDNGCSKYPQFEGFNFGTTEDCNVPIYGYCYYTSTETKTLTS